ncbi:MAG: isomerase, PhzC-PhzF family [Sphingobacteriaceae bacterium]|jgi:PhzF family phenazine biosynthesis protein|nr:isomerase, PhzC-PhzF family [Sphingobacteriaceae bacterium]
MEIDFYQADAFASKPFEGNQAGICILEKELPEELMQQIAMENNIAETAFVYKSEDGFNLRWFTPTVEIMLCGHGTLGSAHILYELGILKEDETARFHTKSGLLTTVKNGDWIEMDFPALFSKPAELPEEAIDALGVKPINVYFSDRYIVELELEVEVRNAKPDFSILKNYETIVLTSKGYVGSAYDFISRTFVPKHGINEDPVTGSSHCALLPYWSEKLGKSEMFAYQASSRGGEVKLRLNGDRVMLCGQAVTVLKGKLFV